MTNTETKIRELKNELESLTKKVLAEELIKSIEKKAEIRDNSKKSEVTRLMHNLADLKFQIEDLKDRIIYIHMVADSLRENGYKVPRCSPNSRIRLELTHNKWESKIGLNIIANKADANDGYLLIEAIDNESDEFNIRNGTINAINRGVWDRGMTDSEKIGFLKLDIDLMSEFLRDFDKFEHDFYKYAGNI